MPKGFVDCGIRIIPFFAMGKRAPPVLHDFHQIHQIADESHRQVAIELAVEDPEKPAVRQVEPENVDGRLILIGIAMGRSVGNKIPIRLDVHAADIFQVNSNQANPDNQERHRRQKRQIDKRHAEDPFPEGLSFIVAANFHSLHYSHRFFH